MKNENNSMNYKIAMAGAFSALSIILSFTPLGYIQLGNAIQITLMHIPVILATLLAGLIPGLATGFVFGVSSLVKFYSAHAKIYKRCCFRCPWNFCSYCFSYGRDFYFVWR